MSDDLLRELARAKAAFQLRAIKAVIADQPSTPPGSTSNASPDATMQASPSGVTSSTENPPPLAGRHDHQRSVARQP